MLKQMKTCVIILFETSLGHLHSNPLENPSKNMDDLHRNLPLIRDEKDLYNRNSGVLPTVSKLTGALHAAARISLCGACTQLRCPSCYGIHLLAADKVPCLTKLTGGNRP